MNGVLRGKFESLLGTVDMFASSILFGYTINFFSQMTWIQFHAYPLYHYWIIFDCQLIMLQLGYAYLGKYFQIEGEVIKNVFTLTFLQDKLLNVNRRERSKTITNFNE